MSHYDDKSQTPTDGRNRSGDMGQADISAGQLSSGQTAMPFVPSDDELALWSRISHRLKTELGEAVWKAWIKPLVIARLQDGTLHLTADTDFLRDRILTNYADRIRYIASYEMKSINGLEVHLATDMSSVPHGPSEGMSDMSQTAKEGLASQGRAARIIERDDAIMGLDPRYRFSNFIVGAPNQLAYAIARRVAEEPDAKYNPLFLYGGVGLGKTHLMHAIAWEIHARQPHRKVMYISAEKIHVPVYQGFTIQRYDVVQRAIQIC